jgi:hypothetical protein
MSDHSGVLGLRPQILVHPHHPSRFFCRSARKVDGGQTGRVGLGRSGARSHGLILTGARRSGCPVPCAGNPVLRSVVQVDACRRKATRSVDTQGRRGRDTGSYVDRGERSEAPPGRRRYVPDSWRRALRSRPDRLCLRRSRIRGGRTGRIGASYSSNSSATARRTVATLPAVLISG